MIAVVNPQSLDRANAFLAAVAARTPVGGVLPGSPADIGHELAFPDPLATARAVRALIARRRLESAEGSYRLLDARPVDPQERAAGGRRARGAVQAGLTYSDVGRAAVDRLVELGREVALLRSTLRAAREEARGSREARLEAEQRADGLAAKAREMEARAEMAEANLRTLLASARGREVQRDAPVGDSEMEAILGVLKGGDEGDGQAPR
jgi:hypothetical protein